MRPSVGALRSGPPLPKEGESGSEAGPWGKIQNAWFYSPGGPGFLKSHISDLPRSLVPFLLRSFQEMYALIWVKELFDWAQLLPYPNYICICCWGYIDNVRRLGFEGWVGVCHETHWVAVCEVGETNLKTNNWNCVTAGLVSFFCKKPNSKYFRLCKSDITVYVLPTRFCPWSAKTAIGKAKMNGCGCVSIQFYLQMVSVG